MRSMTAYSRMSRTTALGRFVVELHSVNRKMLDMSLYLPKEFLRFDIELRKWISAVLERGQVSLKLTLQSEGLNAKLVAAQLPQLQALKESWTVLASQLGFDPEQELTLPFLVEQLPPTSTLEISEAEEEQIRDILHQLVQDALKELIQRKEVEGNALAQDVQQRLLLIEEQIRLVEEKKEHPLAKYRQKLEHLFKELTHAPIHAPQEHEERILKEVALLAEKIDITEEIVRLKTHIAQFKHHLATPAKAIGRTLDFLIQEMNREINTLGSKSIDSHISSYVVKMKSELEKIREQIQNIE